MDSLINWNQISHEQYNKLERSIELILLVKFTLLSLHRKTSDTKYLYLSDETLGSCLDKAGTALNKFNIADLNQFISEYYEARISLSELVESLYSELSSLDSETANLWSMAENKK